MQDRAKRSEVGGACQGVALAEVHVAEVEFGVAELHFDGVVVGELAEDGVEFGGGFAFEVEEGGAIGGEGFVELAGGGAEGAVLDFGDEDAAGHGAADEAVFHEFEDDFEEPRGADGDAGEVELAPGGEVAEDLAGGPVAGGAEGGGAVGGFDLVEVGEEVVDGVEAEGAAVGDVLGVDGGAGCGCRGGGGHGARLPQTGAETIGGRRRSVDECAGGAGAMGLARGCGLFLLLLEGVEFFGGGLDGVVNGGGFLAAAVVAAEGVNEGGDGHGGEGGVEGEVPSGAVGVGEAL